VSKSPAFQYYPLDFLGDRNTLVMSAEEIGAYWLLISSCWIEGDLPNDIEDLAGIARMPVDRFQKSWEKRISRCFVQLANGQWVHPRLEEERAKQEEWAQRNSENGKKGAEKRWNKSESPDSDGYSQAIGGLSPGNGKGMPLQSSSSSSCIHGTLEPGGGAAHARAREDTPSPPSATRTADAAPPSPPQPSQKKKSSTQSEAGNPGRDPTMDHPAVRVYREKFGRTPAQKYRLLISERVTDLDQYKATLQFWQESKYNPANIQGQIDRYEKDMARTSLPIEQEVPGSVALAPTGTGGMQLYGKPNSYREPPKTFAQLASEENARRIQGNFELINKIRSGELTINYGK
jgi:uncharacterized protein YdaU (DUF1376 family)